ncbi:hypothetical protein IPG36_02495 [bacterium]|nr:MAG: hypothetical protein IPG36_02495 [bacterium]
MSKTPPDPLRIKLLELLDDAAMRQNALRDFASVPGNAWLAKAELQALMTTLSDLETLLNDIKANDAESGY